MSSWYVLDRPLLFQSFCSLFFTPIPHKYWQNRLLLNVSKIYGFILLLGLKEDHKEMWLEEPYFSRRKERQTRCKSSLIDEHIVDLSRLTYDDQHQVIMCNIPKVRLLVLNFQIISGAFLIHFFANILWQRFELSICLLKKENQLYFDDIQIINERKNML